MTVEIATLKSGKLSVTSPYHPDFPAAARNLGGKWTGRAWTFDSRDEQRVRNLCRTVYGTDGEETGELVDIRVTLDEMPDGDEYWRFGRRLLSRYSRDSTVKLGPGTVLVEGGFAASGGSRKYPRIAGNYRNTAERLPVVLEVRDVPRSLVEADSGEGIAVV